LKVYLVVMFLMTDGSWLPGDIVAPNGWSALPFKTMAECEEAEIQINKNFSKTPFAKLAYGTCVTIDPAVLGLEL